MLNWMSLQLPHTSSSVYLRGAQLPSRQGRAANEEQASPRLTTATPHTAGAPLVVELLQREKQPQPLQRARLELLLRLEQAALDEETLDLALTARQVLVSHHRAQV